MVKAEVGSAKWVSTQMRKNGTTRLRWYCGLCAVGCKDENGYKCHLETDSHIQREMSISESTKTFKLSAKDGAFRKAFLDTLMKRHFGQAVQAHAIYQELYPHDRPHANMKATCWETLGSFIAQLRKEGLLEAQKGLKGWTIRISSEAALEGSEDEDVRVNAKRKEVSQTQERVIRSGPVQEQIATKRLDDKKVTFSVGALKPKLMNSVPIPDIFDDEDSSD
jgi:DNA/RNA-binding protein KIN17